MLNVVNPTAGLLQDDRITQEATVRTAARLLLTMPGASRAHKVRNGWAQLQQSFTVEHGAFLEVLPEVFIPQAGACYKQYTRLEVAEGGELLFFESLAPGRTAAGEVFQYRWLDWRTDLFIGTKHAARERLRLEPGTPSIAALTSVFPSAYYASVLAVSEKLSASTPLLASLNDLQSNEVWIGQSRLAHPSGWSLRILAQTAPALRSTLESSRRALYAALGRNPPGLRRVSGR
ncbi:MAG: urease accessory protein [Verrucomicrobia bacterium]|nr:MAG: urease accessory protein [Verrucomicrobiota bacterium]